MVVWVRVPFTAQKAENMKGYRKLISDRIPKTWDMALRWCKCRKRYIERIYDYSVRLYKSDVMHTQEQKKKLIEKEIILATDPKNSFSSGLELHRLRTEEDLNLLQYWEGVVDWVNWFSSNTLYIQDDAKYYSDKGVHGDELVSLIADRYEYDPKLVKHILKHSGYEFEK